MDAYDPSEERPRSSGYVTKKDWRILIIAVIAFGIILVPVYSHFKRQADYHRCIENFSQMKNAMFVYMATNNDRFPPAFVDMPDGQPMLFDGGKSAGQVPFTWMSLIQPGMEERSNFICPSSSDEERAWSLHPLRSGEAIASSYGMYLPRAGLPLSTIQNPEEAILVTETSNNGANNSFDPFPFKEGPDGFIIGWSNGNTKLSGDSNSVTRLAFPDTSSGRFSAEGAIRHDAGLNVLFASGRRGGRKGRLRPPDAIIQRMGKEPTGYWSDL